jgi:hypothetical protein
MERSLRTSGRTRISLDSVFPRIRTDAARGAGIVSGPDQSLGQVQNACSPAESRKITPVAPRPLSAGPQRARLVMGCIPLDWDLLFARLALDFCTLEDVDGDRRDSSQAPPFPTSESIKGFNAGCRESRGSRGSRCAKNPVGPNTTEVPRKTLGWSPPRPHPPWAPVPGPRILDLRPLDQQPNPRPPCATGPRYGPNMTPPGPPHRFTRVNTTAHREKEENLNISLAKWGMGVGARKKRKFCHRKGCAD